MRRFVKTSILLAISLVVAAGCKARSDDGSGLRAADAGDNSAGGDTVKFMFYGGNPTAWGSRWSLIKNAKSSIEAQYYIIDEDAYGLSLLGLLKSKIKDGVTVKLMVDARGTKDMAKKGLGQGYLQELVTLGAEIHVYNPTNTVFTNFLHPTTLYQKAKAAAKQIASEGLAIDDIGEFFDQFITGECSNHDKVLIVDDEYVVTGGRNIGKPYFMDQPQFPEAYFDADLVIHSTKVAGQARQAFQTEFDRQEDFNVAKPLISAFHSIGTLEAVFASMDGRISGLEVPTSSATAKYDADLANVVNVPTTVTPDIPVESVDILDNTSSLHDPQASTYQEREKANVQITEGYISMIRNAQSRIWLVNPYVVFTPEIVAALSEAASRNVDIRVISNSPVSTDSYLTQAIFNKEWPDMKSKVKTLRVFADKGPAKLHAKFAIFDNDLSLVGSYNLDYISQNTNSEIAAVVKSAALNQQIATQIQKMMDDNCVEYTVDADGTQHGAREFWPNASQNGRVERLYNVANQFREHI